MEVKISVFKAGLVSGKQPMNRIKWTMSYKYIISLKENIETVDSYNCQNQFSLDMIEPICMQWYRL